MGHTQKYYECIASKLREKWSDERRQEVEEKK